VFKEEAGHGELKGYEDMRPIGVVIKDEIDKRLALPLFGQVGKLVRSLSAKHFKV